MKKLVSFAFVTALSTSAIGGSIYNGIEKDNPELYPQNLEQPINTLPLVAQPGTSDTYGGSPFEHNSLQGMAKSGSTMDMSHEFTRTVYGEWAVGISELE